MSVLDHSDERVRRDLAAFWARRCRCPQSEVRDRQVGNSRCLYRQCPVCGRAKGGALSRDAFPGRFAPWDTALAERYERTRAAERQQIERRHLQRQQAERTDFWSRYDDYLASAAWRAKADKVHKRAHHTCEGCGERPSTQVHHLHYRRVFNELLIDLVALCDACHARCHPDKEL